MATVTLTDANVVTFIKTDPLHVGFATILTNSPGQDAPLVAAANNASGPGSGTVAGDPISKSAAFDLIDPTERAAMNATQISDWGMFPDPIDLGNANVQQDLSNLFATFATTLAAFRSLFTRAAGAFEVYFGKGNICTAAILDAARNSGTGNNF